MSDEIPAERPEIIRHNARARDFEFAVGDPASLEAISAHIEHYVGPIEMVLHELVSDMIHLDLHWVKPTAERPVNTLVTSGMSDRAMSAPEGAEQFRFSELVLNLPADWPMEQSAWEDEAYYWPMRLLKVLARFPHEFQTWLWVGQSVGGGENPEPYHSSTKQCAALLAPCISLPEEFMRLTLNDGRDIYFFTVLPLYQEELMYRLKRGTDALFELFERAGVGDVIDPTRDNVCKRTGWRLPWRHG